MFFVYKDTNNRVEVIGGTVSAGAAKKLAEKRAKQHLHWLPTEWGFVAVMLQGKLKTVYRIEEKKRDG